jgi:hypothetical protein
VAILNHGRLSHLGRLDELRRHEDAAGHLEITVLGAALTTLEDALRKVEGARVTASPAGARIDVPSERHVDAALAAARGCGARLVSVQPVRQSLEDLFVGEGRRAIHAD